MAPDPDHEWITRALAQAAATERAPVQLRAQIDAMARRSRARPARRLLFIPATALIAALLVGLLLVPGGSGPAAPSVAQAAALAETQGGWAGPTAPAVGAGASQAYARFAAVRFPRALSDGTWRVDTWRIERLHGHRILLIAYRRGDESLIYAVAAAPLLRGQRSGYSVVRQRGHAVISWQESDHSCLLTSATLSATALLTLARS